VQRWSVIGHRDPQRAMEAAAQAADLARLLMSGASSSAEQSDMTSSHNAGASSNKRRRLNSGVLSPATLDGSTVLLEEDTKHSAAGPACVSHSSDDGTHHGDNTSYQVQVKVVSPTIGGIAEASRSLRQERAAYSPARESSNGGGTTDQVSQDNSSDKALQRLRLVSFPTECFYTIACSVKIASSKSASRVCSSRSCSSLSSMSSPTNCSNDAVDGSSSLADAIHQPNSSLEFIASCCTAYPCVFVRGKNDALTLCQFSKPKSYAIRPASSNDGYAKSAATSQSLRSISSGLVSDDRSTAPICAATFSESREVFVRLASKFWPGPTVICVRSRLLGAGRKKMHSSSSYSSLSSLPTSEDGDQGEVGPTILPTPALIPASRLGCATSSSGEESYFIAMHSPSLPLARRLLDEVFNRTNYTGIPVCPSPSLESVGSDLSSINSDTDASSRSLRGSRRSLIAIVGKSISLSAKKGAVSSADASNFVSARLLPNASTSHEAVVVNGEDSAETFSVPPCLHGRPVRIVVDEESRTVRIFAPSGSKEPHCCPVSKLSVKQALVKASEERLSRTISAVLCRWKVEEDVSNSF